MFSARVYPLTRGALRSLCHRQESRVLTERQSKQGRSASFRQRPAGRQEALTLSLTTSSRGLLRSLSKAVKLQFCFVALNPCVVRAVVRRGAVSCRCWVCCRLAVWSWANYSERAPLLVKHKHY